MYEYNEILELARQHQAELQREAAVQRMLRRRCGNEQRRLVDRLDHLGCVLRSVLV